MLENKQLAEFTNFMVVEYYIYFLSKIVKFYGDIITIYTGVSNRYNVKIIIALNLKVVL